MRLFLLLLGVLVTVPLFAQRKPKHNAQVLVGMHAAGYGTTSAQNLGITSWEVGASSTSTTATGLGANAWTAVHHYQLFTPGMDNKVKVTGTSYQREIRFDIPEGYTLYINDAPYTNTAVVNLGNFNGSTADSADINFYLFAQDGSAALRAGYATDPQIEDIIWSIGLGRTPNGRPVGALSFRKADFAGQTFSLDALTVATGSGEAQGRLEIYSDLDYRGSASPYNYARRFILSVGNCWLWLDDHVSGAPSGYAEIKVYDPLASPEWNAATNSYRFKIGATYINPTAVYAISSNAPTNDTLTIVKHKGTAQEIGWTLNKSTVSGNTQWLLVKGGVQAVRSVAVVSGSTTTETVTVENGSGAVAQKYRRVFQSFAWNQLELTSESVDPDSLNLTTTFAYGTSGSSYGKLTSVERPDGTYERYDYSSDAASYGKLAKVFRRWQDVSSTIASAADTNAQVVTYSYAPVYGYLADALSSAVTTVPNASSTATIVAKSELTPDFTSTPFDGKKVRKETIKAYYSGTQFLTSTRLSYHPEEVTGDLANRLISETSPEGVKTSVLFYNGKFTDNGDSNSTLFETGAPNTEWGEYRFHGFSTAVSGSALVSQWNGKAIDPVYLVPYRSIVELTVLVEGRPTHSVQYVFTGASGGVPTFEFIGRQSHTFDAATNTDTRTDHRGGLTRQVFTNGRLTQDFANDGRETAYVYNTLGWLIRKDTIGIAASGSYAAQGTVYTHYTYDSAGRLLTEKVSSSATASDPGVIVTHHYDSAGRLDYDIDSQGLQTNYAYTNSGRTTTVTFPGGATKIVDARLDGSLKSITGTGVVAEYFGVTVNGDGTLTRQINLASSGSPRFAKITNDWLGRNIREDQPAYNGASVAKLYFSNTAGQLTKVQVVDGTTSTRLVADTLLEYNAYQVAYRTGLDLDNNGTLDLASADRIAESDTLCEKDGSSIWWVKSTSKAYNQSGNATALTTGVTKQRLHKFVTGTLQSEATATDLLGNQTRQTVAVDRSAKLVTSTTDVLNNSLHAFSIVRNGLLVQEQTAQNLSYTFGYDALRRLVQSVDPRVGTSLAAYYDTTAAAGRRNQLNYVQDPAGNRTVYDYSSTSGRLLSVRQPTIAGQSDKFAYYDYTTRGELYRQWGHIPHPVEYAYNSYGEQTSMSTFRAGATSLWNQTTWPGSPGTADTTSWSFEAATGLTLSKTDAASATVSYTYNKLGQLKTRTWARGVVTTYKYFGDDAGDPLTAEQKSIDYSDTGTSPDLSYTYNRLAQAATIADRTGTRTFSYDTATTMLQTEQLASFLGSRLLTRKYDTTTTGALGRTKGFSLGVSGTPTSDYDVTYGYDSLARAQTVTAGGATFTYSYLANSNLISGVTDGSWTKTNTWNANRDLLDKIETKFSGANKATFQYAYDELGRRKSSVQSGEMFSRYVGSGLVTKWTYDDRNELATAQTYYGTSLSDESYAMAGRSFSYSFDNIGNRTQSSVDGQSTTYANNNLNQVKSRGTPGKVGVAGLAPTAANVTVNSQAAPRQGEYFQKTLDLDNTSGPLWASITISNSLGGSETRKAFLAKSTLTTAQEHQYDADGNLTRDDQWSYTWDAENRLLTMETRNDIIPGVIPSTDAKRLEFIYDYLGRRVQKILRTGWNGSTFATLSADTRFIYDGWNLVGEYNAISSFALTRSYTWGLDLSGSTQGAGGVGGLLMTRDVGTSLDFVYAYDGNGNVSSAINRSTGAIVGSWEYSPFGELLCSYGTHADKNPFRFSTKYTDAETGLVYFGFRYYNPQLGRFVGRDPSGEAGGTNLYAFCRNSSVNGFDYLGLYWDLVTETRYIRVVVGTIQRPDSFFLDDIYDEFPYVYSYYVWVDDPPVIPDATNSGPIIGGDGDAGGVTPSGGGVTPGGGEVTPVGGGVTPGGGEVTPGGGGVTPDGGGVTPGGGGVTPGGGGVTPGGGGVTPGGGTTTGDGGVTPTTNPNPPSNNPAPSPNPTRSSISNAAHQAVENAANFFSTSLPIVAGPLIKAAEIYNRVRNDAVDFANRSSVLGPGGLGRVVGTAFDVAPFVAPELFVGRATSVGAAAESRLASSGAESALQYSQLKAALRLEQSMGNGKFVTNAALELGETRIAVFDQASGKMFIGRPGAMGHIDVVAEHGLTAGDSLIGGAIRVTEGGQMQFLPVSGSFPLPAANATGALNAVRGTGVSIIGGPK